MRTRAVLLVLVALALVGASCSSDKDDDASSTSTSPGTTAVDTTVITTGTTQTTVDTSSSSSSSSPVSIPPVTPPAGQPAACSLLSRSALEDLGVEDVMPTADDRPNGSPAPSNGCQWVGDPRVNVALYYGRDPLEILAIVRQQSPGGVDISGLGQDAYYVNGVLFVDTGSQAFAVTGGATQTQLETLARNVLTNL